MKILILQLKRIGDLILTTPALRCLREAFPQAEITLVIDSSCAGLADAIAADRTWIHYKGKTGLPRFRADWCLDFTGTDRSAWFTFLSSSKRRVTFERFRKKFLRRFLYTDFVDSSVRNRHTADHYTDLLKPLGITRENVPLDLRLPPAATASAQNLLAHAGIDGPYAVLHAGTARPEKYWPAERWAKVADNLRASHGLSIVLTGSSTSDEQTHLATLKSVLSGQAADLSGRSTLTELAALIGGASLFCGVDTAAMHLADAMQTPTLALFGPTNPFHWRPRQAKAIVLRADTHEPFTPAQKGGPMEHISVESALEAANRLLA